MVILTPIERDTLQVFFLHISQMLNVSTFGNTADIYAIVHLVPHACQRITVDQSHSSGDKVAKTQPAFFSEFRIPLLDTVENRCCLLEFCSKSSLHSHNGRGSCVFQNTKWLLKFTERHICYYCLLAANQGNYVRGFFLKKLGEFLSLSA